MSTSRQRSRYYPSTQLKVLAFDRQMSERKRIFRCYMGERGFDESFDPEKAGEDAAGP